MGLSSIEKLFENVGIIRGGILLLKAPDAIKLISKCENENIKILGIDAFHIAEDKTLPVQFYSEDFSLLNDQVEDLANYLKAKNFLENHSHLDLHFEIIIDDL